MTLQVDWPAEIVDQLTQEARQRGLTLDAYLLETILQRQAKPGIPDESMNHRRRAEAAARIVELSQRVKPDPEGWTSCEYIQFGRR